MMELDQIVRHFDTTHLTIAHAVKIEKTIEDTAQPRILLLEIWGKRLSFKEIFYRLFYEKRLVKICYNGFIIPKANFYIRNKLWTFPQESNDRNRVNYNA